MSEEGSPDSVPEMQIKPLPAKRLIIPIIGMTPLIMKRWDEKAKAKMLANTQGKTEPKEPKDPEAEYQASMYRTDDGGYGFPVVGFKSAIVSAARFYDKSVTMVRLRQGIFMDGVMSHDKRQLLTPVLGVPQMREDPVSLPRGGSDLRYRAEFLDWEALLDLTYITSMLDMSSVLALVNAAGRGVGVGEWRPEKSGQNGTFRIHPAKNVQVETQ